jgi:hypothetical protein
MPRKVFTAGEVLAASDVNEFLMDQTVMVFAGTAARGSAIGTATEGMYTHLNDTDTLQYYDGSDWVNRIPTPETAGVTLLNTTSFTDETSVVINNVFSSTYDFYKVYIQATGSTVVDLNFRLAASGTAASGSSYVRERIGANSASVFADTTTATSYFMGATDAAANALHTLELANPGNAKDTGINSYGGRGNFVCITSGFHDVETAHDGLNIFIAGGDTFTGTISIYGYRK